MLRRSLEVQSVLLGLKKTGFGAGRIVGIGGGIEELETPAEAAARELLEEAGLVVSQSDVRDAGGIEFRFAGKPAWEMIADLFVAHAWQGTVMETPEIAPVWCDLDTLPWAQMWIDERY